LEKLIRIVESASEDVPALLRHRTIHRDDQTEQIVKSIIADVRQRGDAALLDTARKFDAPELQTVVADVSVDWPDGLPRDERHDRFVSAVDISAQRVQQFHRRQLAALLHGWETQAGSPDGSPSFWWVEAGVTLGQRVLPVESAGIYVPGGNALYVSSVLMNAIPATTAGVARCVVTTPARPDGRLDPLTYYAAQKAGVHQLVKVGGAAAIAGLALGTESLPRVDKIVGPGNRFVNEAKRQLWGQVGLDGYAGPSEVCVLADDSADAEFAAADLLTQVEHAPDNSGFLIAVSRSKLDEILAAAERQLRGAPREATMRKALANESLAIVARDLEEACDLVNAIAPEHLTLAVNEPERTMDKIKNAGCILLGEYTPESAGDFCLGPSHTLPTSGAARWQSPVNVLDFLKVQSIAKLTPDQLDPLIPVIEAFGDLEGFPAHGRGATLRRRNA